LTVVHRPRIHGNMLQKFPVTLMVRANTGIFVVVKGRLHFRPFTAHSGRFLPRLGPFVRTNGPSLCGNAAIFIAPGLKCGRCIYYYKSTSSNFANAEILVTGVADLRFSQLRFLHRTINLMSCNGEFARPLAALSGVSSLDLGHPHQDGPFFFFGTELAKGAGGKNGRQHQVDL